MAITNTVSKEYKKISDILLMKSKGFSVVQISNTTGIPREKVEKFIHQEKELKNQSGIF